MNSSGAPSFRALDVRPILARGDEPFQEIMPTVDALAPGEGAGRIVAVLARTLAAGIALVPALAA